MGVPKEETKEAKDKVIIMEYKNKCIFDTTLDCVLTGMEVQGNLCQACVAQRMFYFSELMGEIQERSLKVTKLNMIFSLLREFNKEEEAKTWFYKISKLATEWKFPWENE